MVKNFARIVLLGRDRGVEVIVPDFRAKDLHSSITKPFTVV